MVLLGREAWVGRVFPTPRRISRKLHALLLTHGSPAVCDAVLEQSTAVFPLPDADGVSCFAVLRRRDSCVHLYLSGDRTVFAGQALSL